MEYVTLGSTGLKISRLVVGGAHIGDGLDQEATAAVVAAAWDIGVNAIYTADYYSGGAAETIIGKVIAPCRDDIVLMTRVGMPVSGLSHPEYSSAPTRRRERDQWLMRRGIPPTSFGLSRKNIMRAVEDSLRRLGTDYIDVYEVHVWDVETPLEETLNAMNDLVVQGKVRYLGVGSGATEGWRLYKALWCSWKKDYARFESVQAHYNLLDRSSERDPFPAAADAGIGVLAFNSLAGGLLSGLKDFSTKPRMLPDGGLLEQYTETYWKPSHISYAQRLNALAARLDRTPVDLAQGWVFAQPAVTAIRTNPTHPSQLALQARAVDNPLSSAELEALATL